MKNKLSQKDFLKNRRPDEFSDSVEIEHGQLERPILEHFLSTLSQKSLELNFESFVKELCQKVICPNLVEQTGPVAGGDGKTDTQTFPVSDQVQMLWYEGYNDSSHKERWAFAISTQKTWKEKCKKDVIKIVGTDRGYTRAFCITNQLIKSDQRSHLEDKLSKDLSIKVTIFDLSWILDQVYSNKLEEIAIKTLNIPTSYKREKMVGKNDYSKTLELDRLTSIINSEVDSQSITPIQVDYFLEVAKLAKELERPVMEVQGFFDRSVRVSNKFGSHQQIIDAYYEYAWGANFWLEDLNLFEDNLVQVYEKLKGTTNTIKWDKLINLLVVYRANLKKTGCNSSIKVDEIFNSTISNLNKIKDDNTRPSNSLNAEMSLCLIELTDIKEGQDFHFIFKRIYAICEKGKDLIGFPFEKIHKLLEELDDVFFENKEYEKLSDFISETSIERIGQTNTAIMFLNRGIKRLKSNKPYQAIKLIGRSLGGLYKEETTDDFIYATFSLSFAYEIVGLPWASRASALYSSSLITNKFWNKDKITERMVRSYWRLARTELNIGRIIHSLKWFELACITSSALEENLINEEDIQQYEASIAHIILNTNIEIINELEFLPHYLEKLNLKFIYGTLLFVLGYEERFTSEFETQVDDDHITFMLQIRDYNFNLDHAKYTPVNSKRIKLKSNILGCNIKIELPNRSPFIELAEAILSTLESFFATTIIDNVAMVTSELDINLIGDDDDDNLITHEFITENSSLEVEIICSNFDIVAFDKDKHKKIHEWFSQFTIEILCKLCVSNNIKSLIEGYFKDDDIITRSVSFSVCFNSVYNILGKDSYRDIQSLTKEGAGDRFELQRKQNWDSYLALKKYNVEPSKTTTVDVDLDSFNRENIRHDQVFISNLIKTNIWDKAAWKGIVYMTPPEDDSTNTSPPLIALLFENHIFGAQVFYSLREKLGNEDYQEKLQISIVKGISKKNPMHYKIIIGERIKNTKKYKLLNFISRIHKMTPATLDNLNRFEKSFEQSKEYCLSFGIIENNKPIFQRDFENIAIKKKQIKIIDAWSIGENDFEMVAITKDDDPIIPESIENTPINNILQ